MPLQFRRGLANQRTSITPSAGEPVFDTDTKRLYIGDGATAGGVPVTGAAVAGTINLDTVPTFTSSGKATLNNGVTGSNTFQVSGDATLILVTGSKIAFQNTNPQGQLYTIQGATFIAGQTSVQFTPNLLQVDQYNIGQIVYRANGAYTSVPFSELVLTGGLNYTLTNGILSMGVNTSASGIYQLSDTTSPFTSAITANTVTAITGSTTMTLSSTAGLSVGSIISATNTAFAGVQITAIGVNTYTAGTTLLGNATTIGNNTFITAAGIALTVGTKVAFNSNAEIYTITSVTSGTTQNYYVVDTPFIAVYNAGTAIYTVTVSNPTQVTVSSTTQWGAVGTVVLTAVYLWTTPNQYSALTYRQPTQRWTNTSGSLVLSGGNVGAGVQAIPNATTGSGNVALGASSGNQITTSNNNVILGGFTGKNTNVDLRTTGVFGKTATIVLSITTGTTSATAGTATLTFTGSTSYLPASITVTTASSISNLSVLALFETAMRADVTINANWYVVQAGTNLNLFARTFGSQTGTVSGAVLSFSNPPTTAFTLSTTVSDGYSFVADGNVVLSDGAGNLRQMINSNGALSFNGLNYGNSGQFLKSTGSGSIPVWADNTPIAGTGITIASDNSINAIGTTINTQSAAYTLVATDAGKTINISLGGVTIPANVMSAGAIVSVYNNSGVAQTITASAGFTLQWGGQAVSVIGSRTLSFYSLATITFITQNYAVITGNGLT